MERIFRDARINLIIEGTSEIMRLFLAREALDPHLQLAFDMILPGRTPQQRGKALARCAAFYTWWYPRQWVPWPVGAPAEVPPRLRGHWAFVERGSRRLARTLFHQMMRYQAKLEKRQMLLARLVDAGVDLFAMAASISRAAMLEKKRQAPGSVELADLFCVYARQRVDAALRRPTRPEDIKAYRAARKLLRKEYLWLEEGILR